MTRRVNTSSRSVNSVCISGWLECLLMIGRSVTRSHFRPAPKWLADTGSGKKEEKRLLSLEAVACFVSCSCPSLAQLSLASSGLV